jgi:dTDP-4-amino-4,6-dideoxygalactose transaminase
VILPADPKASYLSLKDAIDGAIRRVLDRGQYILGPEVTAFEEEFARYVGVAHCIGVGSGTEALQLALRATGIGPGDAVATVSHTAVATVAAIELAGATPVLVDIKPATYTLDPHCLEETVRRWSETGQRPPIKAVVPVHLYGYPADMRAVMEIADRFGFLVIEDCAQSHGAAIDGRLTGSWGHMAAFSFYPTKNLGALGDGGALVTDDERLARKARSLREYGWQRRHVSELAGMNTRLDELQAAVLRVKLPHLDTDNARRRHLAGIYDSALSGAGSLRLPVCHPGFTHVYHQYVIESPVRDTLRTHLQNAGIGTLIHYPVPVHLQPAYRGRILVAPGGLAVTEATCPKIVSLPLYPALGDDAVARVSAEISRHEIQDLQ